MMLQIRRYEEALAAVGARESEKGFNSFCRAPWVTIRDEDA
jgi:hypothetical protein